MSSVELYSHFSSDYTYNGKSVLISNEAHKRLGRYRRSYAADHLLRPKVHRILHRVYAGEKDVFVGKQMPGNYWVKTVSLSDETHAMLKSISINTKTAMSTIADSILLKSMPGRQYEH